VIRPAFVVGGLMTVTGAFVVYGAVTGNLAAMLAAIFDPGVLTASTAKGGGGSTSVLGVKNPGGPIGFLLDPFNIFHNASPIAFSVPKG
jgi:hypothetical protein